MRMRGALLVGAVLMMTIGAGCGASPNKGNDNSAGGSTTQAPAAARDRTGSNQQTAQEGTGSGDGSAGAGADALTGPNGEKLSEAQILAKVCPDVKDTGDDAVAQGSGDAKNYGSVAKRFTQALAKKCEARDKP
jgi:hypothetical protein